MCTSGHDDKNFVKDFPKLSEVNAYFHVRNKMLFEYYSTFLVACEHLPVLFDIIQLCA